MDDFFHTEDFDHDDEHDAISVNEVVDALADFVSSVEWMDLNAIQRDASELDSVALAGVIDRAAHTRQLLEDFLTALSPAVVKHGANPEWWDTTIHDLNGVGAGLSEAIKALCPT